MRLNHPKFILIILIIAALIGVASLVYAGATEGIVEQDHFAVFEDNSGDKGTQIESDDTALSINPGQKIFVAIQGNWTSLSKDSNFGIKWRTWEGTWTTTAVIGAGSATDWEYWDSNYTHSADIGAHFSGSVISKVIETDVYTDPGDLEGLNEFLFPVEAPTTGGRYELVLWDIKYAEIADVINIQVDITGGSPSVYQKHYRWRNDDGGE